MKQFYAEIYRQVERDHWWFTGRRDMIGYLLRDYKKDSDILDVGCSGGALIDYLKKEGFTNISGIDADERAVECCEKRGIKNVWVADTQNTACRDGQFDIVIASDILEHVKYENKAVSEWYRILKPGGRLIVFVPAFKFLWSSHDEVNQHYRRYTEVGLLEVLTSGGFITERSSYWNFILFFPLSLMRPLQRLLPVKGGHLANTKVSISKILEYILRFENRLLSSGINLPFGISIFAIMKRV